MNSCEVKSPGLPILHGSFHVLQGKLIFIVHFNQLNEHKHDVRGLEFISGVLLNFSAIFSYFPLLKFIPFCLFSIFPSNSTHSSP